MKFCQTHWDELRAAIEERGLTKFVADGGEELARRIQKELDDKKTSAETFDPLMHAWSMISTNAVRAGGPHLLTGDYCPLCEVEKNRVALGEGAKDWIRHASDGVLDYAKTLGLIKEN